MPTTAELRVMDTPQFANAILIHGVNLVFVDHADLVAFNFGGSRTGRLGLSRVGLRYRNSINMRKSTVDDNPVDFTIQDFDGSLARLFGAIDDSERSLGDVPLGGGLPVLPGDDIGARTDLFDKHIGTERIGPAGERALYPSPSGFNIGGKHTIAVPGLDLAGAPVSDNPIVWAGRRITLYRLYRDHVTYPDRAAGTVAWRPFSEAYLQWTGVLRDEGVVRARQWTLSADGIEGYLRKPLGVGFQTAPVRAIADVPTLSTTDGEREDGIACMLNVVTAGQGNLDFGDRAFVTNITATTVDGIRDQIIAEIVAAAAAVGGSGVWNNQAGYSVGMLGDGSVRIGVNDQTGVVPPPYEGAGKLDLCLHRKVWALLGYDIELQNTLERTPDEPRAVMFAEVSQINGTWASTVTGPDYWVGTFLTGHLEADGWPKGMDNDGLHRIYTPQYMGGTSVLLVEPGFPGQVVRLADANLGLGDAASTVAHPGQNNRPVANHSIPGIGGACDRQGLWLFFGKRRMQGTDEIVDEVRIAEASWRNGSGQNAGLVEGDTILVTNWLPAGRFGYPTSTPWTDWITRASAMDPDDGMLQAVPICVLGWREHGNLEQAHIVAQRLLYSTGTSDGWDSFLHDPNAELDAGNNEPAGDHTIVRDAEVAELGLAVPADLVQPPSVWQAEREKIDNDDILDVKLAFSAGYQAMDALRSLLQPIGWSWHMRGGRLGVWCPADSVTQEDVEVVLDRSVKASDYDDGPRRILEQDLRKWAPIDKFSYDYDWAPNKNATQRKLEMPSPDAGFRYRPGEVHEVVMAHGMRFPPRGVAERVSKLSRWWSRRHFEVRGWPIPAIDPGEDCWPGTIIRITDPELVDALGEYGVTGRLGVITGCTTTLGLKQVEKTIDLLIFADTDATPRVHAPSARATAYDNGTRTLTCEQNWLGIESAGTWYDAPRFSEPNYVGIPQFGGVAVVQVYQWDGTGYTATLSGRVASTTNTTIVLSAAGLTGTYLRDQDAIVVLASSNGQLSDSEWPTQLFSPVCLEDGTFRNTGGAFVDGYPWEP